jgi:hypothetical protein
MCNGCNSAIVNPETPPPMTRLAIAIICLFIISCKKDKNDFSLVGRWKVVEYFDANTAWGGCACWKAPTGQHIHELEFKLNGSFRFIYPPVSSIVGCNGNYVKKNDSTLSWNVCDDTVKDSEISYQHPFLFIKTYAFGAYEINKYKKVD